MKSSQKHALKFLSLFLFLVLHINFFFRSGLRMIRLNLKIRRKKYATRKVNLFFNSKDFHRKLEKRLTYLKNCAKQYKDSKCFLFLFIINVLII